MVVVSSTFHEVESPPFGQQQNHASLFGRMQLSPFQLQLLVSLVFYVDISPIQRDTLQFRSELFLMDSKEQI